MPARKHYQWADRLVMYAEAMVGAEAQRRTKLPPAANKDLA